MIPDTMLHGRNYEGWRITYQPTRPVTGRWVAERHGVTLCAGTTAVLAVMLRGRR